ncbi:MAG: hypothetical protein J7559_12265 [Cohnella sp.]|nr:hypothetical protein [Cohnella sp.]
MSNGHTFGVFSKSQKGVTFGNMRASLVEGNSNPNHPDNPASPNRPRVPVRIDGYQNPILGDPGNGQIKRWSAVSLDALEHVIGQMIEQYLRDKSWYSVVRCREALWNMYRRLDWWVNQQTDPMRGDYQRALQMIRDCVYKILKDAEEAGEEHEGVELPYCPAPYQHSYNGTYLNHFDGRTVEVKLFSLPDLGPQTSFPGFFRYMSSTEDQEWMLVHSTGDNEAAGSETIMKLSLDTIEFSNSSKLVFRWRFKKMGYIKFKFMANAAAGNGLTFFINNEQVGGEWNRSNTWQEVKFNVSPGQSYKFDWMVRKQTGELFGKNAVYIKDVECYETIRSLDAPTPPDFDTMGGAAFSISGFDWITFSKRSIVRTDFDGIVMDGSNGNKTRTFEVPIGNECDGDISFAYRMDKKTPNPEYEWNLILQDDLLHQYQDSIARRGSKCKVDYDSNWALRGTQADTVANQAKIAYEVVVGPNCTVDVTGAIAIECPVRRIDHYEQTTVKTMENAIWTRSGTPLWQILGTTTDRELRIDNPVQGTSTASTSFTLANDGWFTFSYDQALRPTETFEVLVDGKIVYEAHDQTTGIDVVIPLKAGMHSISFRVVDTRTEQPFTSVMDKDLQYGKHNGSVYTEYGGYGSMLNVSCGFEDIQEGNASTIIAGNTLYYTVTLNSGGSFQLTEKARLFATMKDPLDDFTEDTRIFSESFNVRGGTHDPSLVMSPNWTWEDIILRFNPGWDDGKTVQDGVMKVEGKNGSVNTIVKQINMASAGYVQFEYGGDFGSHDRFEFYIDNVLVWQEIRTTYGDEGNRASIPIPAGNHQLKWVYRDNGGTTVTVGGDPVTPPIDNLYGEVCFPQGSAVFPALYPASEAGVRIRRHAQHGIHGVATTSSHQLQRTLKRLTARPSRGTGGSPSSLPLTTRND